MRSIRGSDETPASPHTGEPATGDGEGLPVAYRLKPVSFWRRLRNMPPLFALSYLIFRRYMGRVPAAQEALRICGRILFATLT